jgi:hypothetical protein
MNTNVFRSEDWQRLFRGIDEREEPAEDFGDSLPLEAESVASKPSTKPADRAKARTVTPLTIFFLATTLFSSAVTIWNSVKIIRIEPQPANAGATPTDARPASTTMPPKKPAPAFPDWLSEPTSDEPPQFDREPLLPLTAVIAAEQAKEEAKAAHPTPPYQFRYATDRHGRPTSVTINGNGSR